MNPFAHFEDQFGQLKPSDNDAALHVFLAGWNSAMMEMMQRVNKMPFGDDTRASFAVYFQSQMVNVDAIEKPAQFDPSAGTQVNKVWWDGNKLMAKLIPTKDIYKEPEQPAQPQEKTMPITDDHGKAIQHQYRVIEQCGNWFLLYDQHQMGNTVMHEFRIQKLKHDIFLYRGITLAEAKKRFLEKVEADNE